MTSTTQSTATTLSSPAVGAAATTETVERVTAVSSIASAVLRIDLAFQTDVLKSDNNGLFLSFRSHPRVASLLGIYASVVIVSVRAYVWQASVFAANEDGAKISLVRFGVAPRGTSLGVKDSKGNVTSYAPFLPSLRSFATTPNQTTTVECAWGEGGTPFPPGIQLDLGAVEIRHNYPEFLLANAGVVTKKELSTELAQAQLDFTVHCSGQNFGAY